jgi:hypothetical protein
MLVRPSPTVLPAFALTFEATPGGDHPVGAWRPAQYHRNYGVLGPQGQAVGLDQLPLMPRPAHDRAIFGLETQ